MQSWKPRQTHLTGLVQAAAAAAAPRPAATSFAATAATATTAARAAPQPPPLPTTAATWLAQLRLLYGVPIEYLVPDWRMLPAESVRFFFLDRNFTDRLVDGALSIGVHGTRDALQNAAAAAAVRAQVDAAETCVRDALRAATSTDPAALGATAAGFVMRSLVVSGWPGLEVRGSNAGQALPLLRMDRLAPDILLVLFAGVPDAVNIMEPPEGLHFGVRKDSADAPTGYTFLRGLGHNGQAAGKQLPGTPRQTVPFRAGGRSGVVDVRTLVEGATSPAFVGMRATLKSLGALDGQDTFTSAELAIEMVRSAGLQAFLPTGAK